MSKDVERHLPSSLGLACRIAIEVLRSAGSSGQVSEQFDRALQDALGRLAPEEAIRLRGEFAEGLDELTAGGRFQGRRKLEGRLTTIESHVVRDFLNTHGVDAQLRRVTDVTNPVFCVEVWVRPVHFERAQGLMEQLTESRGELTTCREGGEENPQGFAMCWSCGADLVSTESA